MDLYDQICTCRQLAKFVQPVKDRTIFADVETLHLLVVLAHVVRSNGSEEPNVVVGVELGHLLLHK